MEFNVSSVKITGNPKPSGWTQIHDFKPEDENKLKLRGRLIAVISFSFEENAQEIETVASGREILLRLHEEYYGNLEDGAFSALQKAVKKVYKEFSSETKTMEIAAASYINDVIYSAVSGKAKVMVYRNGILAKILEGQDEKTVSASGRPQKGDILFLGTRRFFETFNEGVIRAAMEKESLDSISEHFAPAIHSNKDSSLLGAVLASFGEEENIEVMPEIVEKEDEGKYKKERKNPLKNILEKLGSKLPTKKVYVKKDLSLPDIKDDKSKKTALSAGAVLLALLLISIFFGVRQRNIRDKKENYIERLNEAKHDFDEASSLASLDSARARELFVASQNIAEKLKSEGVEDEELTNLINMLDEKQGEILGEYKVGPKLFVDLSLQSSDFKIGASNGTKEDVLVLDTNGKKVVSVSISNKKTTVEAGPDQVKDSYAIAGYVDRLFLLSSEGVFEVEGNNTKKVVDERFTDSFLKAYNGNLYVLNKNTSEIIRYPAAGSGFSSGSNWLSPDNEVNFSNTTAWAIDGSIWVGFTDGHIEKYSGGVRGGVRIEGVYPELEKVDYLFTNEETEYLYILDKQNNRFIVLTKDGDFKVQYISDTFSRSEFIVVSEKEKKAIVGTDNKLYEVELRHLD